MWSLVTGPERSVLGKITRSGLLTRSSRPPAPTIVAFDAAITGSSTVRTAAPAWVDMERRRGTRSSERCAALGGTRSAAAARKTNVEGAPSAARERAEPRPVVEVERHAGDRAAGPGLE